MKAIAVFIHSSQLAVSSTFTFFNPNVNLKGDESAYLTSWIKQYSDLVGSEILKKYQSIMPTI